MCTSTPFYRSHMQRAADIRSSLPHSHTPPKRYCKVCAAPGATPRAVRAAAEHCGPRRRGDGVHSLNRDTSALTFSIGTHATRISTRHTRAWELTPTHPHSPATHAVCAAAATAAGTTPRAVRAAAAEHRGPRRRGDGVPTSTGLLLPSGGGGSRCRGECLRPPVLPSGRAVAC